MITVSITYPGQSRYDAVSNFARKQYLKRLHAEIEARPDLFSFACTDGEIIGCVGVYVSKENVPCTIEGYVPNFFTCLADSAVERQHCAEIGTRAVVKLSQIRSVDVSIALTATALIAAARDGVRYVGYTATREVRLIARPLLFEETSFGPPDLSAKDAAYIKNWKHFFELGQMCFGFKMKSTRVYYEALEKLRQKDIVTDI